jgi:hypothetical protein
MHRDNRKYIGKSDKYKGVSQVYKIINTNGGQGAMLTTINGRSMLTQNVKQL